MFVKLFFNLVVWHDDRDTDSKVILNMQLEGPGSITGQGRYLC